MSLYLINVGVIVFALNLKYPMALWATLGTTVTDWRREDLARVAREVFFGGGGGSWVKTRMKRKNHSQVAGAECCDLREAGWRSGTGNRRVWGKARSLDPHGPWEGSFVFPQLQGKDFGRVYAKEWCKEMPILKRLSGSPWKTTVKRANLKTTKANRRPGHLFSWEMLLGWTKGVAGEKGEVAVLGVCFISIL